LRDQKLKFYNTCSNTVFQHSPTINLPLIYCPADDTLKSSCPEIHQVATVVMEITQLYSNLETCIVVNGELNKVSLCQK